MTVIVGQGSARISTGTYPSSYGYFVGIDTTTGSPAGESVTITTAPTSNSRIDTIVAYVDLSVTPSSATANNPNNMLKVAAVAGTPAASPTAPSNATIQSAIGASNPFIKLANVLVGTNVTSINNGNITDLRTFAAISAQNLGGAWQSYTPTFTNFTLGNGVINEAKYVQVGKTVRVKMKVTLGSTSAVSGPIIASLPVNASSPVVTDYVGQGFLDNGAGSVNLASVYLASTSTAGVVAWNAGVAYLATAAISSSVPFVWGSGASFKLEYTYEAQ